MERYPWQRPAQNEEEEEGSEYEIARAVGETLELSAAVGNAAYGLAFLFASLSKKPEETSRKVAKAVGISAPFGTACGLGSLIASRLEEPAETSRKAAKAREWHWNLSVPKKGTWTGLLETVAAGDGVGWGWPTPPEVWSIPTLPSPPIHLCSWTRTEAGAERPEVGDTPLLPLRPTTAITGWQPPECPWYKLNTDGSRQPNRGFSGAGGLIRDHTCKYHVGFSVKLQLCDSFEAESWGAYHGLSLAWNKGYKRIILEIDNEGVACKINEIIERKGLNDYLVDTPIDKIHAPMDKIQRLLGNVWEQVKVISISRKANKCADRLADMAVKKNMSLQPLVMKKPPADKRFKKVLSLDRNCVSAS